MGDAPIVQPLRGAARSVSAGSGTISPNQTKKYNPGFYREDSTIIYGYGTGRQTSSSDIASVTGGPAQVLGLLQGVSWGHIEAPGGGNYYIDYLMSLYTQCVNAGKRFSLNVWPAKIGSNGSFPSTALPTYLIGLDPLGVGYIGTTSGPFAKVWLKSPMDNYINMITALGAVFDSLPGFELVMQLETAWAMTSPSDPSYTVDALVTQLSRLVAATASAFPTSVNTFRFNWASNAQCQSLAAQCDTYAAGTGTTDLETQQTPMESVMRGAIGGIDYRPRIPQTPCTEYSGFSTTVTSAQILGYGVNPIQYNYIHPLRYTGDGFANSTYANFLSTYQGSPYNGQTITRRPSRFT